MADKDFGVKRINLVGAAGTPTITSPTDLIINANKVAISTNATVGGNLGIGTTNPIAKLWVNGDGYFVGVITANKFVGALDATSAQAQSVGFATTAINIAYGSTGSLPYQNSPGITTFLSAAGSNNQVLLYDTGTNKPKWGDVSGAAGAFPGIDVKDIDNNQIYYPLLAPSISGTISTVGVSSTSIVFNPGLNYLGIGTTNPLQNIHVLGNLLVAAGSSIGQHITQKAYELNNGTLSWEGTAGQLFSITNNLTSGSIFSVNDVSGIPSIDVNANGTVSLGAYGGNIGIGSTTPNNKFDVIGNTYISGNLGIGTTNPIAKLWVNGDGYFVGVITANKFVGALDATSAQAQSVGFATTAINIAYGSTGSLPYQNSPGITTFLSAAGSNNQVLLYDTGTNKPKWGSVGDAQGSFGGIDVKDEDDASVSGIKTLNFRGANISAVSDTVSGISTITIASNLVGTSLSISGISTLGTVSISSGIISSTTGTSVTFIGNLTGTASYATTAGIASAVKPNSVALGSDTTGDYVQSITGTSNQIAVSVTSGEGSTPTISIPNNPTLPGTTVTIENDLQVNRNLNVTGNITISGTTALLDVQRLQVSDPDLVLGVRTDAFGNDVSNDTTANHGGIAIASTEGSPLVNLNVAGIETLAPTYKKIMWFKSGTFAGLGTDAWLFNYAVGIGSTQFPSGTRLAVGSVQFAEKDLVVVRDINATGIITANKFVGAFDATSAQAQSVGFATTAINLANGGTGSLPYQSSTGITTFLDATTSPNQVLIYNTSTNKPSWGSVTGTGAISGITINNDTSTNASRFLLFTDATSGTVSTEYVSATKLVYNPSSGNLGIGTTTPSSKLWVNGDGYFTGLNVVPTATSIAGLFSGTTSGDMVRITQLGTGNALVVEDQTNPDSSPFVVTGIGSVGIGITNPASTLHITGQFQSTQANTTLDGGGQIYLNGSGGNRIDFNTSGTGAPTFTSRSVGTKIVLYASVSNTGVDAGFGMDNANLWSSVTSSAERFKWYAGTTNIASLFGTGELVLGTTTKTGTASQRLQVDGGAYVSGNLGIGTTNPQGTLQVGTAITMYGSTGIVSATEYYGDGSKLTNISSGVSISTNTANQTQYLTYVTGTGSTTGFGITTTGLVFNPSSGNLGIGSTTPTAKLTVQGNVLISGITTSGIIRISSSTVSPNDTIPVATLEAVGSGSDYDIAIIPKGNGAIVARIPDGTTTGGNKRGNYAVDLQLNRGNATQVASNHYAVIAGGDSNTANGQYTFVGGGYNNITGANSYSSVVGGSYNTTSGGGLSFIGGGSDNKAQSDYNVICGGSNNTTSAQWTSILGGQRGIAKKTYSSVIGGYGANTRNTYGAVAFAGANSTFGTGSGVALQQARFAILSKETTDATPSTLTANGGSYDGDNVLDIPSTTAYLVKGSVIAFAVYAGTGDTRAWEFTTVIKRQYGSPSLVGTPIINDIAYDSGASGWNLSITADASTNSLKVEVTGQASTLIRWVTKIDSTEVAF